MPDTWPAPDEEEENAAYHWAVIRTGLYFIIISILLYSVFVYLGIGILNNSGIISGKLSWRQTSGLVAIFVFLRMWTRAFFK